MIATEYFGLSLRLATVVVPVGLYFLILGFLNSRKHPQVLSGRLDFALLATAVSPLFVLPILRYVGISPATIFAAAGCIAGVILLLGPRGHTWVIYNISRTQARSAVARALRDIGAGFEESKTGFRLTDNGCLLEISGFSLLRNVSLKLRGADKRPSSRFEKALLSSVGSITAEANPAGVSMLLVATGMLAAPLALMARKVPEIVRLLTDMF